MRTQFSQGWCSSRWHRLRSGFMRSVSCLMATRQLPALAQALSFGHILNAISESIPFEKKICNGNKQTNKNMPWHLLGFTKASLVTSVCCFCFSTLLGSENPRKSFYPGLPTWSLARHNIMHNVGLSDASDHPFIHLSSLPFTCPSLCLYIILHKFLERCSPNVNVKFWVVGTCYYFLFCMYLLNLFSEHQLFLLNK